MRAVRQHHRPNITALTYLDLSADRPRGAIHDQCGKCPAAFNGTPRGQLSCISVRLVSYFATASSLVWILVNTEFSEVPRSPAPVITTTPTRAAMMAYSTAVGPSSDTKKRSIFFAKFVIRFLQILRSSPVRNLIKKENKPHTG